ncbi:MAG: cytidylate kinase-like family protein [Deltaproteobacteria bacterium]
MAIITISRGSYSKGKEVAERAAELLGYSCISRDLLVEASEQFNIPEIKLVRALHDAPSILERFTYGKETYLAYVESAFLKHAQKDNMIYHGLAGHFFLNGIQHVLKVRVLADIEDRIRLEAEREKIRPEDARHVLEKDDHERRQWSRSLFGIDTWDPSLYDMVLHIRRLAVEDAASIICQTVKLPHFQTTPESQAAMDDLVLASEVKIKLVNTYPNIKVTAREGIVSIDTSWTMQSAPQLADEIAEVAKKVPGVRDVRVHVSLRSPDV